MHCESYIYGRRFNWLGVSVIVGVYWIKDNLINFLNIA